MAENNTDTLSKNNVGNNPQVTPNNNNPMPGSQYGIYQPNSEPVLIRQNFNPTNMAVFDSVDSISVDTGNKK